MNRKGTEKPIEIFVALFIILAVALVMLKLFQSQIADKQKELSDVQQEQQSKQLQDKVRLACQQKCTEASNNGCSLGSLASLCMYGSQNVLGEGQYIDLDNDKANGMDTTLLAGLGVCEDHVYCFHLVENCCARKISAADCKGIMNEYWKSQRIDDQADRERLLRQNVEFGSCFAPRGTTPLRWNETRAWSEKSMS